MTTIATETTTETAAPKAKRVKTKATKPAATKRAKPAAKAQPAAKSKLAERGSKTAQIVKLCKRPKGASRRELDDLTGWVRCAWLWVLRRNIAPRQ